MRIDYDETKGIIDKETKEIIIPLENILDKDDDDDNEVNENEEEEEKEEEDTKEEQNEEIIDTTMKK